MRKHVYSLAIVVVLNSIGGICPAAEAPAAGAAPEGKPTMPRPANRTETQALALEYRQVMTELNSRRRQLMQDNEEIRKLNEQMQALHSKVNELIGADKEYAALMARQQEIREKLKESYMRRTPAKPTAGSKPKTAPTAGSKPPPPPVPQLPAAGKQP